MWSDLLAALALVLVLEGIMPFANPNGLRRALELMSALDDRTIRILGLGSMVIGLLLLSLVR